MNPRREAPDMRVEISTFWFGPTQHGKVAITSCIIAGSTERSTGCIAADLAALSYPDGKPAWSTHQISWSPSKPDEFDSGLILLHRHVKIEGHEAFHLNFGFMPRLFARAQALGLSVGSCHPYWAICEAGFPIDGWPDGEIKAIASRLMLSQCFPRKNPCADKSSAKSI